MYHVGIVDFLRAEGLTVVEVNGWRSRGSSVFGPGGSVNHHTANASSGELPSLGILVNGTSSVPGPLCNVAQSRRVDGNGLDVIYVVAAGRANHAGKGGWDGLSGNSTVWGLEVEHAGTTGEPFPVGRYRTSVRVHAAFARYSRFARERVCQHHEWAPTRKVDFVREYVSGNQFRADVGHRLAPPPVPPVDGPVMEYGEDRVKTRMLGMTLGGDGNGWTRWNPNLGRSPIVVGAVVNGPYPPENGYWPTPRVSAQARGNEVVVTAIGGAPNQTLAVHVSVA